MGKKRIRMTAKDFIDRYNTEAERIGFGHRMSITTKDAVGDFESAGSDKIGMVLGAPGGVLASVLVIDTVADNDGRFLVAAAIVIDVVAELDAERRMEILKALGLYNTEHFGGRHVAIGDSCTGIIALADKGAYVTFRLMLK